MNKSELKLKLEELGIRQDAYAWEGVPNERYVLSEGGNEWEVYYSERGMKTGLRRFSDENNACEYFLSLLSADKSTKKGAS
jgi:hypothetical protein